MAFLCLTSLIWERGITILSTYFETACSFSQYPLSLSPFLIDPTPHFSQLNGPHNADCISQPCRYIFPCGYFMSSDAQKLLDSRSLGLWHDTIPGPPTNIFTQ